MADDPWAVKKEEPLKPGDPWSVAKEEPLKRDPWSVAKTESTGPMHDVAKNAAPALLKGTLAAISTPRTISDLTGLGVNWAINKIAPGSKAADYANRFHNMDTGALIGQPGAFDNAFPSYQTMKKEIENEATGPLPEPQTWPGRITSGALEALPSLLAGGGGLLRAGLQAAGTGLGGEGASTVGGLVKPLLPEKAQPYVEPVSRGLGSLAGAMVMPSAVRAAVTPNLMTAEQSAAVAALKAKAPDFPMTAGQKTNSPGTMSLEGRSGKFADLPQKQEEAFTGATMREMGSDGLMTPENLQKGEEIGQRIGQIYNSGVIDQPQFNPLLQEVAAARRDFSNVAGKRHAGALDDVEKEIKYGVAGPPAAGKKGNVVVGIPGERYQFLRERLQDGIDNTSGQEKRALSRVREALDNAFYDSLPDGGAELKRLQRQYANYNVLSNKQPNLSETTTPKEVMRLVGNAHGNKTANLDRGTLAPLARNASKVMQELPTPEAEKASALTKLFGMGSGYLLGAGGALAGHAGLTHAATEAGPLAAIAGREGIGPIVDLLKGGAARFAASKPGQAYLGNQLWRPGNTTDPRMSDLVLLLMTPSEAPRITNNSQ